MARTGIWVEAATDVGVERDADEPVVLAAQADPAAFRLLYERHRVAVYRYLRSRLPTDDDAADLTAATFERAIVGLRSYRTRDGVGFRAWLFRIARNQAIDAARRRRPTESLDAVVGLAGHATSEPEAAALDGERLAEVRRLVAALPDEQRDAVVLRFAGGLTAREIGAVLGKSEAAAQKTLSRALMRLKEAYGAQQ